MFYSGPNKGCILRLECTYKTLRNNFFEEVLYFLESLIHPIFLSNKYEENEDK